MEIVKGGKEYFNKRYIKDHPYSLFIYEDTLEDLEFEDYSNVFPIITYDNDGRYFRDKHLEKNKKIIRECIEDIQKSLKRRKYKKIFLPERSIGKGKSKLSDNAPKTYEYIKRKIKELMHEVEDKESNHRGTRYNYNRYKDTRYRGTKYNYDRYNRYGRQSRHRNRGYKYHYPMSHTSKYRTRYNNSNSNSTNTRKIRRRVKERLRKKSKSRKEKKTKITRINSVDKASEFAQKKCNDCIKSKKLLDQDLFDKNDKRSRKFVKSLEKAENKCLQCHKICKYLDKNMKPKMNNIDVYEARYPSICLEDDEGNKRVHRLMNSYRGKMLEQIENYDLNFEN